MIRIVAFLIAMLPALASAQGVVPTVKTSDVNGAAFSGVVAMTIGTTYAAQRSVGVLATVAGNVTFVFSDASTLTLPVSIGWQTYPFAVTSVSVSTATATYFNLK